MIGRWMQWLVEWACTHKWRPASTSRGPARWCERCQRTEDRTKEEFYAEFGRMPHRWYEEK
jgi:hypothetical protein